MNNQLSLIKLFFETHLLSLLKSQICCWVTFLTEVSPLILCLRFCIGKLNKGGILSTYKYCRQGLYNLYIEKIFAKASQWLFFFKPNKKSRVALRKRIMVSFHSMFFETSRSFELDVSLLKNKMFKKFRENFGHFDKKMRRPNTL